MQLCTGPSVAKYRPMISERIYARTWSWICTYCTCALFISYENMVISNFWRAETYADTSGPCAFLICLCLMSFM